MSTVGLFSAVESFGRLLLFFFSYCICLWLLPRNLACHDNLFKLEKVRPLPLTVLSFITTGPFNKLVLPS